ncbi:spermatid maturation protein 1 isoform X2 [Suricata suricatta]|uniref:spermatid maturation protein 1 isoform X2 n=1 Tax=Suricata suricatta TaxID=37032 RepID=UPI001155E5A3|nr:spermatid maturation protein 1 isoform X2 [Suricata suricatta]
MAMAEPPRADWASHASSNNGCQDLGNSILLLLGLIICINIAINMLWHRLRDFLHRAFPIVHEKEAPTSSSPEKQTQPPKQSPAVHLRCTMDPVKMTVTPPPMRRRRHRGSSGPCAHCPVAWAPDTDDDEEKPPHWHPAVWSYNWGHPEDWEVFHSTPGLWAPWAREAVQPLPHTIRFQQTGEGNPLKREMRSELGLEAYVYPVNPWPPSPQAPRQDNCGAGAGARAQAEQEPSAPAPPALPPAQGPATVPDIPRRPSSGRVLYDAREVRRRLRELTREVEALSHCYPLMSKPSNAEGTGKDWVYRSLPER